MEELFSNFKLVRWAFYSIFYLLFHYLHRIFLIEKNLKMQSNLILKIWTNSFQISHYILMFSYRIGY